MKKALFTSVAGLIIFLLAPQIKGSENIIVKAIPGTDNSVYQELFTPESHQKIMEFILRNVMYPSEAKKQDITGKFLVIVRMKKGGIIDEARVTETGKAGDIPSLGNEVVVVGYGLKSAEPKQFKGPVITDLSLLTDEGLRVAKMLGSVKVPEWENGDLEFAITFNFNLKYPEEKKDEIKIGDNSFDLKPEPIFMVDGKQVTRDDIGKISSDEISSVSVLKGESATKVFGDKGKNGVIVVTLKK